MMKINKKDTKILFELDRNSRQSISQIAKKTRLSRDVVTYRISQLQKSGIIKKYITIIDFTKLGYQIVRLYIKLQKTTPEIEEKMVSFFTAHSNNLTVYKTDGPYDLAVGFLVKGLSYYQEIFESFLSKFRTHVLKTHFSIFLDYVHYCRNYFAEKKMFDFSSLSTGSFKQCQVDIKDLELLNIIQENARISLLDLAQKLNLTATGVKYKLNNLQKNGVIVGFKTLFDIKKLGFEYYKVDILLEDIKIIPSLKEYIVKHPNITYRNITVGGSDFEFDCEVPNPKEFYKMMDEIKALFPGKVRSYFYYKALKIYKYSYFPETLLQKP